MARNGFNVADSDMHVREPADLWPRYIDPAYRARAPVGLNRHNRDVALIVNGVTLPVSSSSQARENAINVARQHKNPHYTLAYERDYDAVSQLDAMDREGLDLAVIFPTRGLWALGLDSTESVGDKGVEPDFAAAIARAYNDWLYDFCAVDPTRMFGAGMVAPHDVESAVGETRRCVERLGFKSIFLLPGCVNKRPWHHPYYDPLWAECERLDIPVVFHGGARDLLTPDFLLGVFDLFSMSHTFSHALGPMFAMVSMTGGGVFERFPKLRAGFFEGNCSWAPWLLYRLDDHFEWLGHMENPEVKMKPSEYFKRNCYLSVEADEGTARSYVEALGDDNVVFSTDYPHLDAKFPYAVEKFLQLPLSEETQRKFLWDNCVRFYKLPSKLPALRQQV